MGIDDARKAYPTLTPWYGEIRDVGHSQHGESRILEVIFERLRVDSGVFVEFGAWDGIKYSNTYDLYKTKGWRGVYIEAVPERYRELQKNIPDATIVKINAFVSVDGEHSLDNILAAHNIPEIDLLSIDIDSDDHAIWSSVHAYHPLVVVIEHNPTIPFDTYYVQPRGQSIGNSARANHDLGVAKGYVAVAMTMHNLVFVRDDAFPKLGIDRLTLEEMGSGLKLRVFYGYDGSLVHVGSERFHGNPWQGQLPAQVPRPFRYRGRRTLWLDAAKRGTVGILKKLLS